MKNDVLLISLAVVLISSAISSIITIVLRQNFIMNGWDILIFTNLVGYTILLMYGILRSTYFKRNITFG